MSCKHLVACVFNSVDFSLTMQNPTVAWLELLM